MNAVEIEEAISALAEQPFDAAEFPFAFLEAFGNKPTTMKRLRSGTSNKSDVGGVLQTSNIHIKVSEPGSVGEALAALKNSPTTSRAKAKFVLATDGSEFHAEDLNTGEVIVCDYAEFPDHFGFFLPLAGISTVKQIRESSFDIKATGRLNRLYVELLKTNPDWGTAERRHDMNHFMARLIFCFFAEDTEIFAKPDLFTSTIETMSETNSSNTHEVISELFRAMNTKSTDRAVANIARWADVFPYVNGGLFSGSTDVPHFSKIARSYLLHIGNLDWTRINPDIFGSMIQAVADDEERGALGMHYTSVPNILKVLNPLFLDDLREKLEEAGDNPRKLLNLRNRMAKIRVFDPACGSGNFLVIAYKEMRAIEAEINKRRGEADRRTDIPLTNCRGIELRDFPAEIARLALIIAEYQCDVTYRGQKEALAEFLPLDALNWITCGNALKLDWLSICPPTGTGVKYQADDLFHTPLDQAQIDFDNEGGETYICGNPPYLGQAWQDSEQKADLAQIFKEYKSKSAAVDYVSAWFIKAAEYNRFSHAPYAFVTTNSMWQGQQVSVLWPILNELGAVIIFAEPSFKWKNLASHNAGVIVSIVGVEHGSRRSKYLFETTEPGETAVREVSSINAYLVQGPDIVVSSKTSPTNGLSQMLYGNQPRDGGHLCLEMDELRSCRASYPSQTHWFKQYIGSAEMIRGKRRGCIWIPDSDAEEAARHEFVGPRLEKVRKMRAESRAPSTQSFASRPHRFVQIQGVAQLYTIAVAKVSSERRRYIPADIFDHDTIISDLLFGIYDAPLWNFAIVSSSLQTVWIATVCGKMKTDYRYSNTLGWNTFPVPSLTEKNKEDLTRCAKEILLAREAHFPSTIADLYDIEKMPENLRAAHEKNDEVLERIYIGRRFKNDTERLEKLFEYYSKAVRKEAVR
ncbi:class I SAM-dependent DNA methyltransferase [Fluviibacterium sp. S390]|uniref:class I SAM-dependent DNA methyltransferase n=1 Tax=Fluviibacterium sp. S390 TaxID=3415139 RepID=UPI003C7B1910